MVNGSQVLRNDRFLLPRASSSGQELPATGGTTTELLLLGNFVWVVYFRYLFLVYELNQRVNKAKSEPLLVLSSPFWQTPVLTPQQNATGNSYNIRLYFLNRWFTKVGNR